MALSEEVIERVREMLGILPGSAEEADYAARIAAHINGKPIREARTAADVEAWDDLGLDTDVDLIKGDRDAVHSNPDHARLVIINRIRQRLAWPALSALPVSIAGVSSETTATMRRLVFNLGPTYRIDEDA